MKKFYVCFSAIVFSLPAIAQQKDFEGVLTYKVGIKSKVEDISEKVLKINLALDKEVKIYLKHGNYLYSTGICDQYSIPAKEMTYVKFNGVDTLYYMSYNSDTSKLLGVKKLAEEKTIAGNLCKSILIETSEYSKKYFYAPGIYMNPEYDRNNRIGRVDIYTKETNSIWLASFEEYDSYSVSYECTRLEQKQLDDNIFDLPKLPEVELSYERLRKSPEFSRSGGWLKYLNSSLNPELGSKYVKIPKGETTGVETVKVRFLINEYGRVSNVMVMNKKEAHSKLAEEAVRVITASPPWKPATIFGQKTVYWYIQPVTFQVYKEK